MVVRPPLLFSPDAKKEARTSPPLEAEWGLDAEWGLEAPCCLIKSQIVQFVTM